MKKPNSLSILETIRNKVKKIENTDTANPIITNSGGEHDEFEYIDNSSKNIVESKQNTKISNTASNLASSDKDLDLNLDIEDNNFDFLTSGTGDGKLPPATTTTPPVVPTSPANPAIPEAPAQNSNVNVSLNTPTATNTVAPKDDLDLDLELHSEPSAATHTTPIPPVQNTDTIKPSDDPSDDLNLDSEEEKHTTQSASEVPQTINTPTSQTIPKEDELDLEDDYNLEEPVKQETKQSEVRYQHSDLDEELEHVEIDDLKPTTPTIKNTTSNDDLDFDDLENEEHLKERPETTEKRNLDEELVDIKIDNPENQTKEAIKEDNDLDLSELEDLEEVSEQKPLQNPISQSQETYSQATPNNIDNRPSMISENVANQTRNVIRDLMQAVPKKQEILSHTTPAFKSGETIEDMVLTILEPKLEQWLNENLPTIVEKVVKDEIKRLIPKDE